MAHLAPQQQQQLQQQQLQQQQQQLQQQQLQQQQMYNPNPNSNPNPDHQDLRNLMVNYIPTTVDEMHLRQLFGTYGPIESVKIVCDPTTRQSRGFGFVKYQTAASAQQAINELNGFTILNKHLKVALAAAGNRRPRRHFNNHNNNNNNGGAVNYQGNPGMVSGVGANYYPGNFGGYPQAAANQYAQQQMMAMQQHYMMQAAQPQQGPR